MKPAAAAVALAFGLLAAPASYAKSEKPTFVSVFFDVGAVEPESLVEKTYAEKQPFLLQRLTAVKSATLGADVTVKTANGNAALTKGARLLLALGLTEKADAAAPLEFYCGAFDPKTGAPGWPADTAKVQWVCFGDADKDGVFETAYSTSRNNGARLPSFIMLSKPTPVTSAAYTVDEESNRVFFETAIKYEKTFNIYNRAFFYKILRLPGDPVWHDIVSSLKGVEGGYTAVKQDTFPQEFEVLGTTLSLTGKSDAGVTIKPVSVPKGSVSFSVF